MYTRFACAHGLRCGLASKMPPIFWCLYQLLLDVRYGIVAARSMQDGSS